MRRDDPLNSMSDCLAIATRSAQLLINLGGILPIPGMRNVGSLAYSVFTAIQQMQNNRDDCQELVIGVTLLLDILHQELSESSRFAITHERLEKLLVDVDDCLTRMKFDMDSLVQRSWFIQYWKANATRDNVQEFQREVDNLRLNFLVGNSVDIQSNAQKTLNTRLCPPKASANDSEITADYHKFAPSELHALTSCNEFLEHSDLVSRAYSTCIVKVRNMKKTARFYRGGKHFLKQWHEDLDILSQFKHPGIVQLFGVSTSESRPALVFHDELNSVDEFTSHAAFGPLERILFTFNLILDYKAAHLHMNQYMRDACVHYLPQLMETGLYYSGCGCHADKPDAHTFSCETLINSRGKVSISVTTGDALNITMRAGCGVRTQTHSPETVNIVESMAVKKVPKPVSTDLEACLSAFHSIVISLAYESTFFYRRRSVAVGEISVSLLDYDRTLDRLPVFTYDPTCYSLGRITFQPPIPPPEQEGWHAYWNRAHEEGMMPPLPMDMWVKAEWTRICIPIQEDEGPVRTFSSVRGMLDIDQVAVPWLAQVNYIRSMIHPAVFDPSASITLTTYVECLIHVHAWLRRTPALQGTDEVFLFIHHFGFSKDDVATFPAVYWSLDPEGGQPLAPSAMARLGLKIPDMFIRSWGCTFSYSQLAAVHEFHQICGFNPQSNEVSNFLGLPLVQFDQARPLKRTRSAPHMRSPEEPPYYVEEWYNCDVWSCDKRDIPTEAPALQRRASLSLLGGDK